MHNPRVQVSRSKKPVADLDFDATVQRTGRPRTGGQRVERDGDLPRIGARLRAARKAQGLTLDALVKLTGLDKSFLSRLERDLTSASVASLVRVCEALDIRVGTLFDPPAASLVRQSEAPRVNFGGVAVDERLLSHGLNGEILVLHSTIFPGGHGGEELYTLDTDLSFVTVLEGELIFSVEDVQYHLNAGDSLTLSSRIPHNWRNPGQVPARVIWVTSPHP